MTYEIKTKNKVRARLFAGGTYFRAKNVGEQGNQIAIRFVRLGFKQAKIVVTNGQSSVEGYNDISILEHTLAWDEYFVFEWAEGKGLAKYFKSGEVAEVFNFSPDRLFSIPNKISIKVAKSDIIPMSGFITVRPNTQEFELSWIDKTPTQKATDDTWVKSITWATVGGGFSPDALRGAVSARADSWIEMPVRGFDINDHTNRDELYVGEFEEIYLAGGDGFPTTEVLYAVSPTEYVIHMNLSEENIPNGDPISINKQYLWNIETRQWDEQQQQYRALADK